MYEDKHVDKQNTSDATILWQPAAQGEDVRVAKAGAFAEVAPILAPA